MINREEQSYSGNLRERGDVCESIVSLYLDQNDEVEWCKDVSGKQEYRLPDIDFIYRMRCENIDRTLDSKQDPLIGEKGRGGTINLVFELFRLYRDRQDSFYLGWGFRSKAQIIAYVKPQNSLIWFVSLKTLRKSVVEYAWNHPKDAAKRIDVTVSDKSKTTWNFLLPKTAYLGKIKEVFVGGELLG